MKQIKGRVFLFMILLTPLLFLGVEWWGTLSETSREGIIITFLVLYGIYNITGVLAIIIEYEPILGYSIMWDFKNWIASSEPRWVKIIRLSSILCWVIFIFVKMMKWFDNNLTINFKKDTYDN